MNSDNRNERVSPAETALRRAARGVLKEAVDSSAPIPVWNGTEVVWEVPTKQLEQLDALESRSAVAMQDQ